MPSDDLKTYATSTTDFYALLGVNFETSQRDIDRAWRKTALKYHPDKVGADPIAKEKFHLAQIGYDVLSDPAIKVLYDNARTAREQKKRQNELFEGKRRRMKEDLETRERGAAKRGRDEDEGGEEEKFERELRRLAEDGKRRRKEREEMLRREVMEDQPAPVDTSNPHVNGTGQGNGSTPVISEQPGVPEIDRTIKVRWARLGKGETLDKTHLTTLFSTFGSIENAFLLKDKKQRVATASSSSPEKRSSKKLLVATGVIVFSSVVGAHAAVEDAKKQQGPEWEIFDSVFWAANKEPDFVSASCAPATPTKSSHTESTTPSTPLRNPSASSSSSFLNMSINGSSTPNGTETPDIGLRKKPSFASFSSAAFNINKTPTGSPFGKGLGVNSPSLEEMTMIRLKNAEKKRLEAEIQRQDEEAELANAR
ncbi:hypothetical protein MMC24_006262 [Lignoscripta atroalba]|nr:hypothetical protein [Lignoscripta atroalba]